MLKSYYDILCLRNRRGVFGFQCLVCVLLPVQFISSCSFLYHFDGMKPIPDETVVEVADLGATLGPYGKKGLSEDIPLDYIDSSPESYYQDGLRITILQNDFIDANKDLGDFVYSFSREESGNYVTLLNHRHSNNGPATHKFYQLYISLGLYPGMEEIEETYSYYLDDGGGFILPLEATHLELSFYDREQNLVEPIFVQRWSLDSFYAYNRYIKPVIESQN